MRPAFFPLKRIGQQLQAGEQVDAIWQTAQGEIAGVIHGTHPDEMILDEVRERSQSCRSAWKTLFGEYVFGIVDGRSTTTVVAGKTGPRRF